MAFSFMNKWLLINTWVWTAQVHLYIDFCQQTHTQSYTISRWLNQQMQNSRYGELTVKLYVYFPPLGELAPLIPMLFKGQMNSSLVFQSFSCVWVFATLWTVARQSSLSFTISRVCSNLCPMSQWCHPTISSSVVPFSSCPQSFWASGSFPTSQLFASHGQSIGASASVLSINIQDWFPLGLTGLISLQSKGLSRVFSNIKKSINSLALSLLYGQTLISIHDYWKNCNFDCMDLCQQSKCLCFLICCLGWSYFSSKEQASFNFMAAVTICSDSEA